MGEIHELSVLALSLVWFAGAIPDYYLIFGLLMSGIFSCITETMHWQANATPPFLFPPHLNVPRLEDLKGQNPLIKSILGFSTMGPVLVTSQGPSAPM